MYEFVVAVLLLIKKVPRNPENLVIINQLSRSATSMGANDREADGSISRRDFAHKYSIVRKEGKETHYWLQLLSSINPDLSMEITLLLNENTELIK